MSYLRSIYVLCLQRCKDFSKLRTFKAIFLVEALIIFFAVLGRFETSSKFKTFQRYQEKNNNGIASFEAIFHRSKLSGS